MFPYFEKARLLVALTFLILLFTWLPRLLFDLLHHFGFFENSFNFQLLDGAIGLALVVYIFQKFKFRNRLQDYEASKLSYFVIPFYFSLIVFLETVTIKVGESIYGRYYPHASTWGSGLEMTNEVGSMSALATFVLFVIKAPIEEELLFRGIVFEEVRKKYGFISTLIFSTSIFTLAHMTFYSWSSVRAQLILGLPPVFIAGLLFGLVRARYSLVHSTILHILINSLAFWYQYR